MADNKYNIAIKIDSTSAKSDADKIKNYLEDIKKEAIQMQRSINNSFDFDTSDATSDIEDISNAVNEVDSDVSSASDSVSNSMGKIGDSSTSASEKFKKIGSVATKVTASISAVAGALTLAAQQTSEYATEIFMMANRASTSVEEIQRLQYAFRSLKIDGESMSQMFKDAQDKLGDFNETGAGPLVDFFNEIAKPMGQTIDDFKELTGPQIIEKFVKMLKESGASQSEMIFYMEGIASESTDLLPLLKDNADSLEAMKNRADELNLVLSRSEIKKLREMGGAMNDFKQSISGSMRSMISSFSTEITTLTTATSELFAQAAKGARTLSLALKDAKNFTIAADMQDEISRLDSEIAEMSSFSGVMGDKALKTITSGIRYFKLGMEEGFIDTSVDYATSIPSHLKDVAYSAIGEVNDDNVELQEALKRRQELKDQYDNLWSSGNRDSEFTEKGSKLFENDDDNVNNETSSNTKITDEETEAIKKQADALKYLQVTSYQTKISVEDLKKAQKDIAENDLYPFFDTMSEKMSAYINDNDLLKKSNESTGTSYEKLTDEKGKALEAIVKEISKLEQSNDTFEKSSVEMLKYRMESGDLAKTIDLLGDAGEEAAKKMLELQKSIDDKKALSTMNKEIESLKENLKSMGLSGRELIENEVMSKYGDQIEQLGDKGVEAKDQIIELQQKISDQELADSFMDGAKTEIDELKEKIASLNSVSDLLTDEAFSSISSSLSQELEMAKIQANEFQAFMYEAGQEVRESFTSAIAEGLQGDFDSMFDSLQQTITQRLAELLSDQLFDTLANSFSGSMSGSAGSFLSGLFAGRQSGGSMSPNQSYLVGEKGPEIITPTSPSYATSNHSLRNGKNSGSSINVGNITINSNSEKEAKRAQTAVNAGIARAVAKAQSRGDI